MKKSMFLSFVTAGAIIATSVGTYAVWDTLEATSKGIVNFGKPVTVETTDMQNPLTIDGTRTVGVDPTFKSEPITFKTPNIDEVTSMALEAKVYDSSDKEITSGITTKIYKDDGLTEVTDKIQKAELVTTDTGNKYIVKITPTDGTLTSLQDVNLTVKVTATLE